MSKSIPEQLRFPPVDGMTVRGNFEGGTLSSDFGPMLLRGIDHQLGLTHCLAQAFDDQRRAGSSGQSRTKASRRRNPHAR